MIQFHQNFNPIPTEGDHFGPRQPKAVSHFHSFMTRVTKIHDFVHLSIPLVPVKLFLHARHSQGHVLESLLVWTIPSILEIIFVSYGSLWSFLI